MRSLEEIETLSYETPSLFNLPALNFSPIVYMVVIGLLSMAIYICLDLTNDEKGVNIPFVHTLF
jgi:hypothetical protein